MTPAPEILDFNARAENFPVAGWFIAKHLRPAVRAYYAFARLADDIADATDLSIIKKLSALDDVEKALLNGTGSGNSADDQVHQVARSLGAIMRERDLPMALATNLLTAFRADARNTIIFRLDDLRQYCTHSAAPVGRFLLAIHHASDGYAASDALCAALQILNHVQDAHEDARLLKRCYIPLDWLNAQGIDLIDLQNLMGQNVFRPGYVAIRDDYAEHVAEDGGERTTAIKPKRIDAIKLRTCLNMLLDEVEVLLVTAQPLPRLLMNRGLAAQSAAILCLARRLLQRLRAVDPWHHRVDLRAFDWMVAGVMGARVRLFRS